MKNNDQTFRSGTQSVNSNYNSSFSTEASAPLTTKELGILQEQLIHEALAYKKWTVYQDSFSDQQLVNLARQTANHHKMRFDSLQSFLNSHM